MSKLRIIFVLLLTIIIACNVSCGNASSAETDDELTAESSVETDGETDDDKFIQLGFASIHEFETLQQLYDFADGIVIGKITDIGEPYRTDGGKIDSSIFKNRNVHAIEKIRIPFEVTVIYCCKGDFETGETFTYLGLNGPVDGYTFGYKPIMPIPEYGETYLLALGIYSEDEIYLNSPSLLHIESTDEESTELDRSAKVEPLFFDSAYEGIKNVGDLLDALDSLDKS